MNAFLISGVSALPFQASAFMGAPDSTLIFEGNSTVLRSDADLDAVESKLLDRYPKGSVHRMSRDVIVFGDETRGVVQKLPSVNDGPVLDFSALTKPAVESKPVVFFHPNLKKRYSVLHGWLEALSVFGYDIRLVGRHEDFRKSLIDIAPDIVCLSAYELHMGSVAQAYRELAGLRSGAVTLLGGYAAYPSAANFFDIVVPGEADFTLPLLLKLLQIRIAEAALDTDLKSDGGIMPTHLTPEISQEIRDLSAGRFNPTIVGDDWHELSVDVGSQIYIRGRDDNAGSWIGYDGPKGSWPIPINPVEMKTLWTLPPASESFQRNGFIYAQRGCKASPDRRCSFCSITSPAGRRLEVQDVIDGLVGMRDRGVLIAVFGDDNFLSNRRWTSEFLDGIEREKLGRDMRILMATRADSWTEPLVRRMLDLGLRIDIGLEAFNPVRAERLGKVGPGRGEAYVKRGLKLLRLGAEYSREKKRSVGDLVRAYIIMAGNGDSLDDVLDEVKAQLVFARELHEGGMRTPWLSANITERIHARSPIFESSGSSGLIASTRFSDFGEHLDGTARTRVEIGEFVGDFHVLHVDSTGEAFGIVQPRDFKRDKFLGRFIDLVNEYIYGKKNPDHSPNPDADTFYEAALSALARMPKELEEYYGSKERAEEVVREIRSLYDSTYP